MRIQIPGLSNNRTIWIGDNLVSDIQTPCPNHSKNWTKMSGFQMVSDKLWPFVRISNGRASGFKISFEIWYITNPTFFWPFKIRTNQISTVFGMSNLLTVSMCWSLWSVFDQIFYFLIQMLFEARTHSTLSSHEMWQLYYSGDLNRSFKLQKHFKSGLFEGQISSPFKHSKSRLKSLNFRWSENEMASKIGPSCFFCVQKPWFSWFKVLLENLTTMMFSTIQNSD